MTGDRPIIVLGAGGHGKVLIDALIARGAPLIGITDPDEKLHGLRLLGIPVLGADDTVADHGADDVVLVNGIGSTWFSDSRRVLYDRFVDAGYTFRTVVHPSAVISPDAEIADGVHIMAGAVVQAGCKISVNSIVNTQSSVDHDCVIGAHVHIAPGAVLGGDVTVGEGTHIGAGATVIQNIGIGAGALVAAGATVVLDVPAGARVAGTPARQMKR